MTILYNPFHNGLWLPCKLGGTQPAAALFLIPEPSLEQVLCQEPLWKSSAEKGMSVPVQPGAMSFSSSPSQAGCQQHTVPWPAPLGDLGPASAALLHPIPVQGVTAQEEWGTATLHATHPLHWSHNMLKSVAKISPVLRPAANR